MKLSSYAFYGGKSVSYVLTKNYVACVPVRFLFFFRLRSYLTDR